MFKVPTLFSRYKTHLGRNESAKYRRKYHGNGGRTSFGTLFSMTVDNVSATTAAHGVLTITIIYKIKNIHIVILS